MKLRSWILASLVAVTMVLTSAQAQSTTITVAMEAEPNSLDPALYNGVNAERVIRRIFEGLTAIEPGGTDVVPALAESWEISADGLTYTFHLRPGVQFQDGTKMDAEAVAFSLERTIKQDHPLFATGQWAYAPVWLGGIADAEAVDELTLSVVLKNPDPSFLAKLTLPGSLIISPAAASADPAAFPRNPVGTGPYAFERWDAGSSIILRRFDGYWGDLGVPERIVYRWIAEDQARVAALLTGEADVIVPVPADYVPQLAGNSAITVLQQPGIHVWYLGLNTERGPTADLNVRKALAYAIDRAQITENILNGTAIIADSPIVPGSWAYEEDITRYDYDVERARELLAASGWTDSNGDGFLDKDGETLTLSFWMPASGSGMQKPVEMSTFVAEQWRVLGVRVETQVLEWGSYLQTLRSGEFNVFANSFMPETVDPDITFSFLYASSSIPSPNRMRFRNDRVDELIALARTTVDQAERAAYYGEALQIVTDQVPTIFIDHDIQTVAARAGIEGVQLHTTYDVGVDRATVR